MRRWVFVLLLVGTAARSEPRPPAAAAPATPPPASAWIDVTCRWANGRLTVEKVERGAFDRPTVTRRFVGRFEARVSGRGRLLDVVRFDFPLLADADAGVQRALDEKMKAHVTTTARVRVPLPDGADAVAIADSHGGRPVPVPLAAAAPVPDGGAR
jgi:hypothetical protein